MASRAVSMALAVWPLAARTTTESRSPESRMVIDTPSTPPGERSTSISRTGREVCAGAERAGAPLALGGAALIALVSGEAGWASANAAAKAGFAPIRAAPLAVAAGRGGARRAGARGGGAGRVRLAFRGIAGGFCAACIAGGRAGRGWRRGLRGDRLRHSRFARLQTHARPGFCDSGHAGGGRAARRDGLRRFRGLRGRLSGDRGRGTGFAESGREGVAACGARGIDRREAARGGKRRGGRLRLRRAGALRRWRRQAGDAGLWGRGCGCGSLCGARFQSREWRPRHRPGRGGGGVKCALGDELGAGGGPARRLHGGHDCLRPARWICDRGFSLLRRRRIRRGRRDNRLRQGQRQRAFERGASLRCAAPRLRLTLVLRCLRGIRAAVLRPRVRERVQERSERRCRLRPGARRWSRVGGGRRLNGDRRHRAHCEGPLTSATVR